MSEKIRTTIYLTKENRQLLKKVAYLLDKPQTEIMNEVLKEKLEVIVDEIEKKQG